MRVRVEHRQPHGRRHVVQPQRARRVAGARRARRAGAHPRGAAARRQRHAHRLTAHLSACVGCNVSLY